MLNTTRKILGYVLTLMMPMLMLLSWYLQGYYVDHRPTSPDVADGRTVSLNVHGTTIYLTVSEYVVAEYAFFAGIFCGLAGGAILRPSRRRDVPTPTSSS